MVHLSGLGKETLWEIVKQYTSETIIQNIANEPDCYTIRSNAVSHQHIFYVNNRMQTILTDLIQKVGNHMTSETNIDSNDTLDISYESLEMAGEMFIYANLCPRVMYEWKQFYVDLMQNASPDVIVQTLNRVIVTAKRKNDKTIMNIGKNLFMEVTKHFALQFQTIDVLTKIGPNLKFPTGMKKEQGND